MVSLAGVARAAPDLCRQTSVYHTMVKSMLPHFGEFRNSFSPAPIPVWQGLWAAWWTMDRAHAARLRHVHHATGLKPGCPSRPHSYGSHCSAPERPSLARPWWTTRAGYLLQDHASTRLQQPHGRATAVVGLGAPDSSVVMAPEQKGSVHVRWCVPPGDAPRTYGRRISP